MKDFFRRLKGDVSVLVFFILGVVGLLFTIYVIFTRESTIVIVLSVLATLILFVISATIPTKGK